MKNKKIIIALIIVLISYGCSFAPKYKKPSVELSDNWVSVALKEQNTNSIKASSIGWENFFLDPQLKKLIKEALNNNHDLKKAALNIELAKSRYGITKYNQLPLPAINVSATRAKTTTRLRKNVISENYKAGLGLNAFEIDFFGKVKNMKKASLNKYLATREARDSAQLSIIKSVAKTYYSWRINKKLEKISEELLKTYEKTHNITDKLTKQGLSSNTDLYLANSSLQKAIESKQKYISNQGIIKNALSVLVGRSIDGLDLPKSMPLTNQLPKKKLFIDTPSKTLLNRPDIRQAEYALKSSNADIGAARALMFPMITLTSNTGYSSGKLNNLIDSNNALWSFSPSIYLPIFNIGQLKEKIESSEIKKKIAIENYKKAIQSAFRDVSNALIKRKTLDNQYYANTQDQDSTDKILYLTKKQLQEGLINELTYLNSKRANLMIRQKTLVTLNNILNNKVDLYLALGGGLKS